MLGLYRRIHSTELLLALDLNTTVEHIKKCKLNLFNRLINNTFTKEIIDNILNESASERIENSLLNDVNDLINIFDRNNWQANIDRKLIQLHIDYKKNKEQALVQQVRCELAAKFINHGKIEDLLKAYESDDYINIFDETNI
jgi:hypothetical protein